MGGRGPEYRETAARPQWVIHTMMELTFAKRSQLWQHAEQSRADEYQQRAVPLVHVFLEETGECWCSRAEAHEFKNSQHLKISFVVGHDPFHSSTMEGRGKQGVQEPLPPELVSLQPSQEIHH